MGAENRSPLRILAGDDPDPNRTATVRTEWTIEDGRLRSDNETREPPTYRLDGVPASASAVGALALATDGARKTLHRPVVVPLTENWQPVADAPVGELRVLESRPRSDGNSTSRESADQEPRVALRHERHGHWRPVRNATVRYETDGYVIENPETAMVDTGRYVNYTSRLEVGHRTLLRTAGDPSRVSIPRSNGTAIAEPTAGGQVPARWADPGGPAIRQHWARILRATPGAFDGERLLVGEGPLEVSIPGDFTGHVPSSWSERESCGPRDNTRRRWERWSIADIDHWVRSGGGALTAVGPGVYRVETIPAHTLTIEHVASLEIRHEWGVDDDCGRDRRTASTVRVNHTVETNVSIAPVEREPLTVTAYALDRANRPNELHYHVAGNRGPTRGGLGSVTFTAGEARHSWQTPWSFYPVRTYDEVARLRENGSTATVEETSFRPDASVATVYRDRIEAEGHVVSANDLGVVPTVKAPGADTSNRALPPGVSTSPIAESLYTHYGGTAFRLRESMIANGSVELTARNLLGEPVDTRLRTRRYRATSLAHRIGDRRVWFRLTAADNGLGNRTVRLRGARRSHALTNETGWVGVRPTAAVVRVHVPRTPYRADRSAYYEPSRASVVVPAAIRGSVWTVSRAVWRAIWWVSSVAGWLSIGWLLRWHRRRRP
jgi:hypothetical protein